MRPDPTTLVCEYGHVYSEESARAKLTRHRSRGDLSVMAVGCPDTDHWHVIPREAE